MRWTGPIIDRDPKVPLSEREPIARFNGARNYLQWLATVSLPNLENERFFGPDWRSGGAPIALLYVLLRYSLLTAVEEGTLEIATVAGEAVFRRHHARPADRQHRTSQHLLRQDYLAVNAEPLGLSDGAIPLGNWVHESAQTVGCGQPWAVGAGGCHRRQRVDWRVGGCSDRAPGTAARRTRRPVLLPARCLGHGALFAAPRTDASLRGTPGPVHRCLRLGRESDSRIGMPARAFPRMRCHLSLRDAAERPGVREHRQRRLRARAVAAAGLHRGGAAQRVSVARHRRGSGSLQHQPVVGARAGRPDLHRRASATASRSPRSSATSSSAGLHERHPGVELDQYRYVLRDRFPYMAGN